MAEIWSIGEMIVEIMRTEPDCPLDEPNIFKGPYPSGAPAICMDTVARLGHTAGIISGVGQDDFGKCLLNRMKRDGVDVSQVAEKEQGSTGAAFVTYFSDGSRKFIFHLGNTPAVEGKCPPAEVFENIKYFHIMGCSLTAKRELAEEILRGMKLAKSLGGKISFDPNIRMELLRDPDQIQMIRKVMEQTDVFLPGTEELLFLTGKEKEEAAAEFCFSNSNMEILAVKQGARGCRVYTRTGKVTQESYPVKTVDSTGAGDCFDGAFLCGLLEGRTVEECARMGAAAGALNAAAFGPMEGNISRETLDNLMGRRL